MKNLWQMQIHPGKNDLDLNEISNIIESYSVIGMGEKWKNDGGAPNRFRDSVKNGDIVVIRHQGSPRYLVEIVGECKLNEGNDQIDVWFELYRKVKILCDDGPSYKEQYEKETGKKWSNGLFPLISFQTATNWDFANYWYNKILERINMEKYLNLLKSNYNLILTGAPGTGKTYRAKQIAAQMILGKSYDEKNNEEKKMMEEQLGFVQFHPSYDYTDFVEGLRPANKGEKLGFEREDGIFMDFCRKALKDENNKYVFIIDEINRGDISKIFGELFFCIDPGYRGIKGKIKTQYHNLWKENFDNDKSFYIPENVYIIGTMNDIDRSVESMDFAMRRRFAWKEIKADENVGMLDSMEDSDKIINRMNNLNAAIEKIEGLSSAYHIGGSYFMKLKDYINSDGNYNYDDLWTNHLEGLLREYMRGMTDVDKKIVDLKIVFGKDKSTDSDSITTQQ